MPGAQLALPPALGRGEDGVFLRKPVPRDRIVDGDPGALDAPASEKAMQALFDSMRGRLEPSPIVFEFLDIMRTAPIFPAPLRALQRLLIRAAVEMTPTWVRERLDLSAGYGLRTIEKPVVRWAGRLADRVVLGESPAVQACRRLGLPADYLYRRPAA